MTAPRDFRQHLEVETPEHVLLDYEVAGLGSRTLAALLDLLVLGLWVMVASIITGWLELGTWGAAALVTVAFASFWGYFTFFEALRQGQTPGKRWMGIRVVRDTGHPVTFGAAAARNLLRVADFLPAAYLLGGLCAAVHPRGKRLGDLLAGTVVVRDQPMVAASTPAPPEPESPAGPPELDDESFAALAGFAERAGQLAPDVRARLAARLADPLAERHPTRPADPEEFLRWLYHDELARRRGRFGARSGAPHSPADARGGGPAAERLAARQHHRWNEFQALADRAARSGLDGFAARELPDFAARYREIAADLARARTYRAAPPIVARLERLVAAGHNVLYRDERQPAARTVTFLLRDCPAAVVTAWRSVALAGLIFTLAAGIGFALIREQPALAEELLPATMLERADAGQARAARGQGYYEAEAGERPLMASVIMTNNIKVAFVCFSWGIFLGVGSLWALAYNGLALGTASGHFANRGLLGYLWAFIAGHGVLELFSIWVAGAAGFLLGRALIAPGNLPRAEALVVSGRLALRLIGATIFLLVIAGLIEGFVSASTIPTGWRLGVSLGSLLFLVAYLLNGRMALGRAHPAAEGAPAAPGGGHS